MSAFLQKYLFEAGLHQISHASLQEMSDKALDLLAPEDGLEVAKKSKVKGLLDPKESWSLQKIEYLEGSHGEAEYETCENCKKSIRYVCTIMGDDQHLVGPDCALTLLPAGSEDAKSVELFVGKRIAKNKFVKNAIKLFESSAAIDPAEEESYKRLKEFYDGHGWKDVKGGSELPVWSQMKILNSRKSGKVMTHLLYDGYKSQMFKKGVHGLQFPAGRQESDAANISTYAVKKWLEKVLNDQHSLKSLSQAFEKVWEEQVSLRNKKYFFDPKSGLVSEFLDEFKDSLGGDESIF